jgi:enoyl-CoA hydratase/carnithine racemase
LVSLVSFTSDDSDLVVASTKASFALPEVKRGVFAKAGALGRIIRFLGSSSPSFNLIAGLQRASELALIGEPISPQKMHEWGVVNAIVPPEELIPTAMKYARKICENSPDAVIVSRTAMLMSLERIFPYPYGWRNC